MIQNPSKVPHNVSESLSIQFSLSSKAGDQIGVQAEQRHIKRGSLISLHPLEASQQQLLEKLRVKIRCSELEQATSNDQSGRV